VPYVNLPPGCRALNFPGGRVAAAREGGRVFVSDARAKAIDSMGGNGDAGLVTGKFRSYGSAGTPGRWCTPCRRLWYAWSASCPRCGAETVPEEAGTGTHPGRDPGAGSGDAEGPASR
jgi:hypothetical protein